MLRRSFFALLWGALLSSCAAARSPSSGEDDRARALRCDAYEPCGIDQACDQAGSCIKLRGCARALCVDASEVCKAACGSDDCAVLESYPMQMPSCADGRPIRLAE